ncbi:MAG: hypothetical protein WDA06_09565 [Phenylobacterium sp.]
MNVLYRYDTKYNSYQIGIACTEYEILKKTPKGAWIEGKGKRRFILDDACRKWAWPTKKEALISFLARKRKQLHILDKQFYVAKQSQSLARVEAMREGIIPPGPTIEEEAALEDELKLNF